MFNRVIRSLRTQWIAVVALCFAVGVGGAVAAPSVKKRVKSLQKLVKKDQVRTITARKGTPVTIPAGGTADAFAKCEADESLVGGGSAPAGIFGNGGNGGFIQFDGPDTNVPNQWQVKVYSTGGATLTVTAYCAKK